MLTTQGLGSGEGLRMAARLRGSRPRTGRAHVWDGEVCRACAGRRHWPIAAMACGGGSKVYMAAQRGRSR